MIRALVWQTVCLTLLLSGCSKSPTRRVTGEVSYKGESIASGTIEFVPIEGTGGPSVGGSITEGAYDVPAAKGPLATGTYRVKLWAMKDTGKFPPGPRYPKSTTVRKSIIPEEYNIESKLQVTIDPKSDPNRIDFHLPQ